MAVRAACRIFLLIPLCLIPLLKPSEAAPQPEWAIGGEGETWFSTLPLPCNISLVFCVFFPFSFKRAPTANSLLELIQAVNGFDLLGSPPGGPEMGAVRLGGGRQGSGGAATWGNPTLRLSQRSAAGTRSVCPASLAFSAQRKPKLDFCAWCRGSLALLVCLTHCSPAAAAAALRLWATFVAKCIQKKDKKLSPHPKATPKNQTCLRPQGQHFCSVQPC